MTQRSDHEWEEVIACVCFAACALVVLAAVVYEFITRRFL